jgi:hypothetical protein
LLFGVLTEVMPVGVAMALAGVATICTAGWIAATIRPNVETPVSR